MANELYKSELPDNLTSEQSQYEAIKLLGNTRSSSGNGSFSSSSSLLLHDSCRRVTPRSAEQLLLIERILSPERKLVKGSWKKNKFR